MPVNIISKNLFALRFSTTALIFLLTILSCTKDETQTQQLPPGRTYLTKIYQIDSTASGKDTLMESLTYDNMKRVVIVADSIVTGGVSSFFAKEIFYYLGSDTLPYKSSLDVIDGTFIDSINRFFLYDNQGRKIIDSIISKTINPTVTNRKRINTYHYVGNRIFGSTTSTNLDNPAQVSTQNDTATLDAAGNVLETIENAFQRTIYTNTYDNYPTPFSKTNILASRDVFIRTWTDYWLVSPNNQVYNKIETVGSTPYEAWLNYQYNSEGYPTRSVRTESTRPDRKMILEFEYSPL